MENMEEKTNDVSTDSAAVPESSAATAEACEIDSVKDVNRYAAYNYAHKFRLLVWLLIIASPFPIGPFFTVGLFKYKKGAVVLFVLYFIVLLFTVAFLIFVLSGRNIDLSFLGEIADIQMIYILGPGSTYIAMFFGLITAIYFSVLGSRKGKKNKYMSTIEDEVLANEGAAALDKFVKSLIEKSKKKDVEVFVAEVTAAHARYEARKDILMSKKDAFARINEIVAAIAASDGAEHAAEVKKQCYAFYNTRDFEAINALYASVIGVEEKTAGAAAENEAGEVGAVGVDANKATDVDTVGVGENKASDVGVNGTPAAGEPKVEKAEYIKPKTSKRGQLVEFIVLTVMYGLLLIAGILLLAVEDLCEVLFKMGICEEIAARPYAMTIGTMWLALVPTYAFYFATLSPFMPGKKGRIIIFAVTVAVSIAMDVVFFIVINVENELGMNLKMFFEGSDTWFIPASMVLATVGMIVCYLLTLFKLNPEKIKDVKPQKTGESFSAMFKYILQCIVYAVMKFAKFILKFKEHYPEIFIIVASLLLTWLVFFAAFVFAVICMVIMLCVVLMMFSGFVEFAYTPSTLGEPTAARDEYGNETDLEKLPYVDENGDSVYSDKYGNKYYSDDGGKTFYKK